MTKTSIVQANARKRSPGMFPKSGRRRVSSPAEGISASGLASKKLTTRIQDYRKQTGSPNFHDTAACCAKCHKEIE